MHATRDGFELQFTQPLGGWRERGDARLGAGGSSRGRIATRRTTVRPSSICAMRRSRRSPSPGSTRAVDIALASTEVPKVHPRQTARVYHVKLASQTLFDANAPAQLRLTTRCTRFR